MLFRILTSLALRNKSITKAVTKGVKASSTIVKASPKPAAKSTETILTSLTQTPKKSINSKIKKIIAKTLNNYNTRKLEESKKFWTSERILDKWNDVFGIKNKNGVFQNAIDYFDQTGSIDNYIIKRLPTIKKGSREFESARQILKKYLTKNLDIYTYERIEKILKNFDKEISQKLKNGAVIYIHDETKSYGLIADIYKSINPDAKFIKGWNNLKEYSKVNKQAHIIMLDDCIVSGESTRKVYECIKKACPDLKNVDMYTLCAFKEGLKNLPKDLNIHYDGQLKEFLKSSEFFKSLNNSEKGTLLSLLGTGSPEYNAYSAMMFPYMSPNNNSRFAVDMIKEIFSGPECALKGIFQPISANNKVSECLSKMLERIAKDVA